MNIYRPCWQQTIPEYFKIDKSNEFILTQVNPLTPFATMSEIEAGELTIQMELLGIFTNSRTFQKFSFISQKSIFSVFLTSLPDFDELKQLSVYNMATVNYG